MSGGGGGIRTGGGCRVYSINVESTSRADNVWVYQMIVLSREFILELWLSFSWNSAVSDPSKRYQLAASQSQDQSNYCIRLRVSGIIVSVIFWCLLFIRRLLLVVWSSSLLNVSHLILFLVHVDSIFPV